MLVEFHRHSFRLSVLDEATSAVDADMESRLYDQCRTAGITVLSVGHRESLRAHHHWLLTLNGGARNCLTRL